MNNLDPDVVERPDELIVYGGAGKAARNWPAFDMLIVLAPFSIFAWTWFDPQGQFLHDRLLGTELHDLKPPAPASAP